MEVLEKKTGSRRVKTWEAEQGDPEMKKSHRPQAPQHCLTTGDGPLPDAGGPEYESATSLPAEADAPNFSEDSGSSCTVCSHNVVLSIHSTEHT